MTALCTCGPVMKTFLPCDSIIVVAARRSRPTLPLQATPAEGWVGQARLRFNVQKVQYG